MKIAKYLAVSMVLVAGVLFAGAPESGSYRDGAVLAKFQNSFGDAARKALLLKIGATDQKRIGVNVHVLRVAPARLQAVLRQLRANPAVRFAEPDYVHHATGAIPNDASLGNQWGLRNTGQVLNGNSGPAGSDAKAVPVWSMTTGTNAVVVAVLDSGAQYTHPDLFTNMWNNPGTVGGCPVGTHGYNVLAANCDPLDDEIFFGGHGTHVSGILGASGNDGNGTSGSNWTTSIMAVKWINAQTNGFTSDLITAMDWVIAAKQTGVNVRIVNDSAIYVGLPYSQALADEIDLLGANDILFVGASGNDASNNDATPDYPCSYARPTQICVAALDMDLSLWVAANYGATTVHLGAPGANVFSTLRQNNYGYISGGSMAAPLISGTAALILSLGYQPAATLKSMILNAVDPQPSLNGKSSTGGSLNMCKAVPGCSTATVAVPASVSAPVINGIPQFGSLVAGSTGVWSGLPSAYAYQWYRCNSSGLNCAVIPGATSKLYGAFSTADAGATVQVRITASNVQGSTAAFSAASALVSQPASSFNIGSTILTGTSIGGAVQWQATPSQAVSWLEFYVDGVMQQRYAAAPYIYNLSTTGLLDTSTLSAGVHALGIRALATGNRTFGYYAATVTVTNGPANTVLPAITGVPAVGSTLTTSNGTWNNSPTGFAYQWLRCDASGNSCTNISGANVNTYAVAGADANLTLRATVTATNASGSTPATSAAVLIAPPSITTNSLPSGTVGIGYNAALTASGGISPYSWAVISGALPSGMALNSSTGAITGSPSAAGSASFTIRVTDAASQTATKALSINVAASGSPIMLIQANSAEGTAVGSLSTSFPSANAAGNLMIAFVRMSSSAQTLTITDTAGNVYTDAVSQVQSSDGHQIHLFYAKNSKAAAANTVTATFSATNNHPWISIYEYAGLSATSPLDKTAAGQGTGTAVSTSATAATFTANELVFVGSGFANSYSGLISAGPGYSLQQQDSGTSRASTEALLASSAGSFSGTQNLSAAVDWSAVLATFTVPAAAVPPSITTTSLPGGTVGVAYSQTISASGGVTPYIWSVTVGSLPAGLSLNAGSGLISGSPTAAGTSNFTVQVKDANNLTATQALSIAVSAAGSITQMQAKSVEGTAVANLSAAFAANNTAGNLIIAFVRMSSSTQTVSVTDTLGNTYTDAVSQVQTADGHQIHLFYARNIKVGANTVKATFSATNNHPWLAIYEYRGLSKTAALDKTAKAQGNGTVVATAATATTAAANELIFTGGGVPFSYAGTITAGAGYALQQQDLGTSRAITENLIVSATGTFTGTFGLSTATDWTAVTATFK